MNNKIEIYIPYYPSYKIFNIWRLSQLYFRTLYLQQRACDVIKV
jgi:hypothetical protein